MKKDIFDFIQAFLGVEDTRPARVVVLICGALALTISGGLLSDLLRGTVSLRSDATLLSLGVTASLVLISAVAWVIYWRRVKVSSPLKEGTVPPYPGLIWMLTPNNLDAAHLVLTHHQHKLLRVWVILTAGDDVLTGLLQEMRNMVAKEGWGCAIEAVEIESPELKPVYDAVTFIYRERVPAVGLSADRVCSDITGGNKPMTAGMALACLRNDWHMEYLASEWDGSRSKKGTEHLIDLSFDAVADPLETEKIK